MQALRALVRDWDQPWSRKAQWIGFTVALILFIGWQWYHHHKSPYNPIVTSAREFFSAPTWYTFKKLVAAVASDPWQTVAVLFLLVLFPAPFLPHTAHGRIKVLLSKLGVLALLALVVIGTPSYDVKENQDLVKHLPGILFGVFILSVAVVSSLANRYAKAH